MWSRDPALHHARYRGGAWSLYPLLASFTNTVLSAEPAARPGQAWGGGFPLGRALENSNSSGHLRAEPQVFFSQAGVGLTSSSKSQTGLSRQQAWTKGQAARQEQTDESLPPCMEVRF